MTSFRNNIASLALGVGFSLGSITISSVPNYAIASSTHPITQRHTPSFLLASSNFGFINKRNGVAIKGTDPVAYFSEGRVRHGNPQFSTVWQGATWHFANAQNRDRFQRNPSRYAPQYGGHCAWAAAQGYVADIDPNAWKIVNGKLYLNLNQSIHRRWEQNQNQFIANADQRWPAIARGRS